VTIGFGERRTFRLWHYQRKGVRNVEVMNGSVLVRTTTPTSPSPTGCRRQRDARAADSRESAGVGP